MVRLRREIDGVRRNYAVPTPGYAQDPVASARVLPALDAWLLQQEPGRVLLAGALRRDLAQSLAAAGHWVTVADLTDDEMRDWHAQLRPEEAAHLTLMARSYGEIAFGPAVFDRIALFDALGGYREPAWVINKVARELKPDGYLVARALIHGPIPAVWPMQLGLHPQKTTERVLHRALDRAESLLQGRLASMLLGPAAHEAIDRGAHLAAGRFAMDAEGLHHMVAASLQVEQAWVASPDRTRGCDLLWGAREPLRAGLLRAIAATSAQATMLAVDATTCAGLLARRALAGGVRFY